MGEISPIPNDDENVLPSFASTNLRVGVVVMIHMKQLVYRLQTLGYIKNNVADGKVFQDSITGNELIRFLVSRKQCTTKEEAKRVGQSLLDAHIFVMVDGDEDADVAEDASVFVGESELYYLNDSILEQYSCLRMVSNRNDVGRSDKDVSQPVNNHNQIVRMSGYLNALSIPLLSH